MLRRDEVRDGLWQPGAERAACGVGLVAHLARPSRQVVDLALEALGRLRHRGAVAADGRTGDGAGLLLEVPQPFFSAELRRLAGPDRVGDAVAVGMLFLPQDPMARAAAQVVWEAALAREGLAAAGLRAVPVRPAALGDTARRTMPYIGQLLVPCPPGEDPERFERRLYHARRRMEEGFRGLARAGDTFHVASLSARTLVYKALLTGADLAAFFPDLAEPALVSRAVVFHQRFSTNTSPSWSRAQPFRRLAHNGEVNTLWGNRLWAEARLPGVIDPDTSDSGMLDNVAEHLALFSGRDLPHALRMLIPEAYERVPDLPEDVAGFLHYHACLTEPWDGPAAVVFSDGQVAGAVLDRNGLRPLRYTVTEDGLVVLASEAGVVDVPPERVRRLGKLGPGEMLVVDLAHGRVLEADDVRRTLARRRPYAAWVKARLRTLEGLAPAAPPPRLGADELHQRQAAFAYSSEEVTAVLRPMAQHGKSPNGAMGDDTPLAVLSRKERPLFHYFHQRFAQVTNPPLDPLREGIVFAFATRLGPRRDIRRETPAHALRLELPSPVLLAPELAAIRAFGQREPAFRTVTLPTLFRCEHGPRGLEHALRALAASAEAAIAGGAGILVLSDRGLDEVHAPMPALLATAAVHHHLLRRGLRLRASLVVETGEARAVHHVATLLGYGAEAVCPYLALDLLAAAAESGRLRGVGDGRAAQAAYRQALLDGLAKVMARMGISTVDGYIGAQVFEAVGLAQDLVERHFPGTPSRVGGVGLEALGARMLSWHRSAFPRPEERPRLFGFYQWREGGEDHLFRPAVVEALQAAVADPDGGRARYGELVRLVTEEAPSQLRHLLAIRPARPPVPLAEVEPAAAIVRRFSTGSMSLGSLSPEAHETLAVAMNRLGGRSGSGEGGEDPARFGTERNSRVKQVASGRFGVTPAYLASAGEIQIKMAQGSKPGEGGQIPGHKVTPYVAALRHTSPGVSLISPPPHHDIYSIEDLAQLIHDLRQVNPAAEISVKLVAETGVGLVAAGVAKAGADIILVSGHAGGTGSSPLDSIKHAGVPWEIGLSEVQQTLVAEGLRERVRLRVDGGLRTGRDVLVAALLGAEEFSFGTAAMIAVGCRMMRICHTDNCPVGVATQKEALRRKFTGTPEQAMRYFLLLAEEVRECLAELGARRLDDVVGQVELVAAPPIREAPGGLDLRPLLAVPAAGRALPRRSTRTGPATSPVGALDAALRAAAEPALSEGREVALEFPIENRDRTVGARLFHAIAERFGDRGLPAGRVAVTFRGTAGQSFGAFMTPGVSFTLVGAANDYVGKGMAGGEIVVRPHPALPLPTHEAVLLGNTALYGATGGLLLAAGRAGERFAVRNSGATAVVEGVGDHGCEYMTRGTVVVLGAIGRNFAAGMTGGEAFVLDLDGRAASRVNPQLVTAEPVTEADLERLLALIRLFAARTGSSRARLIVADASAWRERFLRVVPRAEARALTNAEEGSTA